MQSPFEWNKPIGDYSSIRFEFARGRWKCYACGIFAKTENAHIVPRRNGGVITIPLCVSCHDYADRTPLADLPVEDVFLPMMRLWGLLGRVERLLLMKLIAVSSDILATVQGKPIIADCVEAEDSDAPVITQLDLFEVDEGDVYDN